MIVYYKDLLAEHSFHCKHVINYVIQHIPRLVGNDQITALMRPISFQVVEMVVMNIPKNRAPNLVGYTSDLFQTYWSTLGNKNHDY